MQAREGNPRKKSWVEIVMSNRAKKMKFKLRYVSPSISNGKRIVKFHNIELKFEEEKWRNALIESVIGAAHRFV